ncbi:trifunctional histidinol dehydrogenase [Thoreauomyces humboldtii]|nr:trifunctional histidinol dehydrogenase [Thoreauomyces humboldtii]
MILPSLSLAQAQEDPAALTSFALVGDVLLTNVSISDQGLAAVAPLLASTSCWVEFEPSQTGSLEAAIAVLQAGASKVVVPVAAPFVAELLEHVSLDRVVLSITLDWKQQTSSTPAPPLTDQAYGYLFTITGMSPAADDAKASNELTHHVKRIREATENFTRSRISVRIPDAPATTAASIAAWDKHDVDLVTPTDHIAHSAPKDGPGLTLGDAFSAPLTSDRQDGLFATVVVDEQRVALGLCYSSRESIAEALRTRTGVYQSRARGLWYKGASSGATQRLVRVAQDCDGDALLFVVEQQAPGFCHKDTRTCFGPDKGLTALQAVLQARKAEAPAGSYTRRLFEDPVLLHSKIMEEADELVEATTPDDIAWEAADLIYFALTKCVANGVTLADVEKQLDRRAKAVNRRAGDAKPKWDLSKKPVVATSAPSAANPPVATPLPESKQANGGTEAIAPKPIRMKSYVHARTSAEERKSLLLRPIINTTEILSRVRPIVEAVRLGGDSALLSLTARFDNVHLETPVLQAPFPPALMAISDKVKKAIDQAYDNITAFHEAQLDREVLTVETMPGVVCTRFFRPIERVGLYVPGGTAVLPSSTLMLGIPAMVAGCKEIVVATPPRSDGTIAPEVVYVANKVGASCILVAGGAQAVAAMAYGTETVPKVDKICGPGNQYVTAAKMVAQSDNSAMVSIDMPAGPSELLVIADSTSVPSYVASDLLSQAEHGTDSQVVLVAVGLSSAQLEAIHDEVSKQGEALPRRNIVRESIGKSFVLEVSTVEEGMRFSNAYAPEHLILHCDKAEEVAEAVDNAGSVFVGPWSPESCGDYASGTNHTLPTYGYARMYSGVNTLTFVKHITSQKLTKEGLNAIGDTVTTLAEVEGLEAHRNAVAIRLKDIRRA